MSTYFFRGSRFFPAQIASIDDVPSRLRRQFSKVSDTHAIVKWITETNFSVVRRSRVFPVGRTEVDKRYASKIPEVMERYLLALEMSDA